MVGQLLVALALLLFFALLWIQERRRARELRDRLPRGWRGTTENPTGDDVRAAQERWDNMKKRRGRP